MKRRNLIKGIVVIGLILFSPVLVFLRIITGRQKQYVWHDQPGELIPTPEEVCGQIGFKSSVSKDGKIVVVTGNPEISPHLIFEDMRLKPDGEYVFLITFRTSFFVAESPFSNFRFLWKNLNTSFTVALAVSPCPPYKLAAIIREYPYEFPESYEDAVRIYQNDKELVTKAGKEIKNVFDQGYEENVYLIDITNGKQQKLANISEKKSTPRFCGVVNDKAMVWNSTGEVLVTHNMNYVFSIDMSGNLTNLYELKDCAIFSSLACDNNDNISFIIVEKRNENAGTMLFDGESYLVQIDASGREIKREKILIPDGYEIEENNISFVGDTFVASTRFKSEGSKDSVLRVIPRIPEVPQQKPAKLGKKYSLHDPNEIQFYYSIQGYLADTNEFLLAKKRLLSSKQSTPYTPYNVLSPWVELRRFQIVSEVK
jgi:hypothetical protein